MANDSRGRSWSRDRDQSVKISDLEQPHDREIEAELLSSLIRNPDAIHEVSFILKSPEQFFADSHRAIYRALLELNIEGRSPNMVELSQRLRQNGDLDKRVSAAQVGELVSRAPTSVLALDLARFVNNYAQLRALQQVGVEAALEATKDSTKPANLLNSMQEQLLKLGSDGPQREVAILQTALAESLERFKTAYENRKHNRITAVSSGYRALDDITGGWDKSELIILAARPAMGKTALALNFVMNAVRNSISGPHPAVFFSLEMSKEQLAGRIWASEAKVDSTKIRDGNVSPDDHSKLLAAIERLKDLKLFIDDTPSITVSEIIRKSRQLKQMYDIQVVVIDYLQLISASSMNRNANREQVISEISRGLKILAKDLDIPVIALAQLNRGVEKREKKRPILSDLRESGAIEQDADIIMFIHREKYYEQLENKQSDEDDGFAPFEDDDGAEVATIVVAKNRSGATGDVELLFDKGASLFLNLNEIPPPDEADFPAYVLGQQPGPAGPPGGQPPPYEPGMDGPPMPDHDEHLSPAMESLGLDGDDF